MINVKMIAKCRRCEDAAKINEIFIDESNEEIYLVKEYICDCGFLTEYREVINYTIN